MNFWQLLRVINLKKWYILGFALVTVVVIIIAAPEPKIVYTSSTYMSPTQQVMSGGQTTAREEKPSAEINDRNVVLSNLIILAKGGEVYQKALDFLALPVDQQQIDAPDISAYKQITRITNEDDTVITYADWQEIVDVMPVQNNTIGEKGTTTDVISITVKHYDPQIVPYISNAIGYAFAQVFQEKSRQDNRKYAKFLEISIDEARANLKTLQQEITNYKQTHNVISVDQETMNAVSSMAQLNALRDQAAAKARAAQAALSDINSQLRAQPVVKVENLPSDLNPEVKLLKESLSKAEADLRLIATRYTPSHQLYKTKQGEISSIREQLKQLGSTYSPASINELHTELVRRKSDAEYNLATSRAELSSLSASIGQAQNKAKALTAAAPNLIAYLRDYDQAEKKYKDLVEKLSQTQIAEKEFTRTGSIVPFDWARPPAFGPVREGPTKSMLAIYGLVLSLIVAVMVSVWLDSIDNRMRSANDVQKLLQLPILGTTPSLPGKGGNGLPKLTHIYPLSAMAESYRILRTNILFELRDKPFKTLMVATGRPGQGATTTICNLAIALAQIGKKIILIDADMRRPSLHKFFDVPNEAGLSTLLNEDGNLTDAFQQTGIDNLIVVPAGPQPLNPSELLGSDKMKDIVARLQEHCDLVLFDTPSTVVFSDGPMLASWIDAVIMVVSANQAPRGTEAQTRDLLKRANANILGVVVNRMTFEEVDSCHYYSHYYSDSVAQRSLADIPITKKAAPLPKQINGSEVKTIPLSDKDTVENNPFPD